MENTTESKKWITIGASLAMFGVMIGAFGAHALKPILLANQRIETFETAVKYHFYHALGLLLLGVLAQHWHNKWLTYAGYSLLAGIVVFSGSLYILCLTNLTIFGAITPIGGLGMIAGWMFLVIANQKRIH